MPCSMLPWPSLSSPAGVGSLRTSFSVQDCSSAASIEALSAGPQDHRELRGL